ncbi:hypothetical protein BGX31_000703 [Mortierella sp. GBA43]|nr:hypothetical protein BGX31_000703 [Mortierella sp. GBA43]
MPRARQSPLLWTQTASLATEVTTLKKNKANDKTNSTQDAAAAAEANDGSKLKGTKMAYRGREFTPEDDARLLKLRDDKTGWDEIRHEMKMPIGHCKARYMELQRSDSEEYVGWSWKIDKSTEHEKSLRELENMIADGKTWREIVGALDMDELICRQRWSEILRGHSPKTRSVFGLKAFVAALRDPFFQNPSLPSDHKRSLIGHELYDWDKISEDIFESKFSPAYLRHRFINLARIPTQWSTKETSALRRFTQRATTPLSPRHPTDEPDWFDCSESVFHGHHSPYDCRRMWLYDSKIVRHPGNPQTPERPMWTVPEIFEFHDAWKKEGADWAMIAKTLADNGFQPRTFNDYQISFNTLIRKAQELQAAKDKGEAIDMDQTYRFPPKTRYNRFHWTDEQLQKLKGLVEAQLEETNKLLEEGRMHRGGAPVLWVKVVEQLGLPVEAWQCKTAWERISVGFNATERRKLTRFKHGDLERLLEIVKEVKPKNSREWDSLRNEYFPDKRRVHIRRAWYQISVKEMIGLPKRMRALELALLECGERSWTQAANILSETGEFTTSTVCKGAWEWEQKKATVDWTPDDVSKLITAVEDTLKYKPRRSSSKKSDTASSSSSSPQSLTSREWFNVGKLIDSKTSLQCRAKYTEMKFPELNNTEDPAQLPPSAVSHATILDSKVVVWTKETTKVVVATVKKYGPTEVAFELAANQVGCTSANARQRWLRYTLTNDLSSHRYIWTDQREKVYQEIMADYRQKGLPDKEAFARVAATLGDCTPAHVSRHWRWVEKISPRSSRQLHPEEHRQI